MPIIPSHIFREYDIRGIVGTEITEPFAKSLGLAFGEIISSRGGDSVTVGYDGRLSSPNIESSLVIGLIQSGIHVVRIGCVPTPEVYFADIKLNTDGAIMVTGSHNPPNYNGFKLVLDHKPFFADDIQNLHRRILDGHITHKNGSAKLTEMEDLYIRELLSSEGELSSLKIAWDPGNGAAGDVISALTKMLPGKHYLINEDIDGTFPNHHPDPTIAENLKQLKAEVIKHSCDVGFAFDGDGDRLGVLDQNGRLIDGDQLLALFAEEALRTNPDTTVITDVKASQTLFDHVKKLGGKVIMTKTGHSHIKDLMIRGGHKIAGEVSGHFFFADHWYGFDDAIYAAIRVIKLLSTQQKPLSDLVNSLPKMLSTPELRIPCDDHLKFKIVPLLSSILDGRNGIEIDRMDGLRVKDGDGWWLIRPSNTQAVIVARLEAKTSEGLFRLKSDLYKLLDQVGLQDVDLENQSAGH